MNQLQECHQIGGRAEQAVLAVLPRTAEVAVSPNNTCTDLIVNGQQLTVKWAGEGNLGDVRRLIKQSAHPNPDIVVARRLSPGARAALDDAGIGWVDETGAAEIAIGLIIVSRQGAPTTQPAETVKRWTPAVMAVAEALLCRVDATVAATVSATGLSTGSCTNALRYLTRLGLLKATADRGRNSARRIVDHHEFLASYASATEAVPNPVSVQVGFMWRDSIGELVEIGKRWNAANVPWAATGAAAAAVMAPYLSDVASVEVYVESTSIVGLEAVARTAGLQPVEGGRLTLRPFPSAAVARLRETTNDLCIAPWPRVYVDLRRTGVRGEEAAEHLLEVIRGR